MNYVYDILLNFNKENIPFYEWNEEDEITHVRKIMLFKIDSKTLSAFKNSEICISNEFLTKICKRTEVFTMQNIKYLEYACLLTNGKEVIGVKFNNNGRLCFKSALLLDEENEILELANDLNTMQVPYKIIKPIKEENFMTRSERNYEKFICQKLKDTIKKENSDKLKYLYYECFDKKEEDINVIADNFFKELKNNWDESYMKVYNFLKMIPN
jgi:hypothetical protein